MTRQHLLLSLVLLGAAACGDAKSGVAPDASCLTGSTYCEGTCVYTMSDQLNCGACGKACPSDQTCNAGTCTDVTIPFACPSGLTDCSGTCKDTDHDLANCGACGNACGAAADCSQGTCTQRTWDVLAVPPFLSGYPDYVPPESSAFYTTEGTGFEQYVLPTTATPAGAFTALAAPPSSTDIVNALAWIDSTLWVITGTSVLSYSTTTNTWSTVVNATLTHGESDGETTHDDNGVLYNVSADGNVIEFDTTTSVATYASLPPDLAHGVPRVVWDSATQRLYIGDYDNFTNMLYAFNPGDSAFERRAALPEALGYNIAFCSDRAGHIFTASAATSERMWVYTTTTDTWAQLPLMGVSHSDEDGCVVADGYLYVGGSFSGKFQRLKL
jgi:hypothetical protein